MLGQGFWNFIRKQEIYVAFSLPITELLNFFLIIYKNIMILLCSICKKNYENRKQE